MTASTTSGQDSSADGVEDMIVSKFNQLVVDEHQSSDGHNRYALTLGILMNSHNYSLDGGAQQTPTDVDCTAEFDVTTKQCSSLLTEDASLPTSCEGQAAGDGKMCQQTSAKDNLSSNKENSLLLEKPENKHHEMLFESVPEAQSPQHATDSIQIRHPENIAAAPDVTQDTETNTEISPSSNNCSHSVEYNLSSDQPLAHRTIQVSRCKARELPVHMARLMGCKASFIQRPKSHTAKIQTRPKNVKETHTQSLCVSRNDTAMQVAPDTLITDIQTSPIPYQMPLCGKGLQIEKAPSQRPSANIVSSTATKMDTNFAPETGTDANNKVSTTTNNSLETPVGTLDFNKHAKSKVGTFTHHKPGGGDKKIPLQKLDFRTKATSRIGSLDNAKHKPQGGGKKVYQQRLRFKETASPRISSLDNVNYIPGGGDKPVSYQVVAHRSKRFSTSVNPHSFLSRSPKKRISSLATPGMAISVAQTNGGDIITGSDRINTTNQSQLDTPMTNDHLCELKPIHQPHSSTAGQNCHPGNVDTDIIDELLP